MIERLVDEFTPGDFVDEWDLEALWVQLDQIYHVDFGWDEIDRHAVDREELKRMLTEDALGLYDEREEELGEELMRALERYLILQIIDQRWREHLYDMDYLREGIHLRGFAQIEPLVAYKNEAFTLFEDLMNSIWSDFARMVFNVEVQVQGTNGDGDPQQQAPRSRRGSRRPPASAGLGALAYSGGIEADQPTAYGAPGEPPALEEQPGRAAAPRRRDADARPQRPVLVRLGQEVQEVPRRLNGARRHRRGPSRARRSGRAS